MKKHSKEYDFRMKNHTNPKECAVFDFCSRNDMYCHCSSRVKCKSDKRVFFTKEQAEKRIKVLKKENHLRPNPKKVNLRPYECDQCGFFHLTSMKIRDHRLSMVERNKSGISYDEFESMSDEEMKSLPEKVWKSINPFVKRSCHDCHWLEPVKISYWCTNRFAIERHRTSIPGGCKCPFWQADFKQVKVFD